MKLKRYSKDEKAWLVKNVNSYATYKELHKAFVKKFRAVTYQSLISHCYETLKIRRKNDGKFGNGKSKPELPLFTERELNTATYIKVKESKGSKMSGYDEPYWLPKQKYVYEQFYKIKVPKDKFIIFLDGNRHNYFIDNLYCIDRKISAVLARYRWYTTNKENTLTAIKWCELYYALKVQKRSNYENNKRMDNRHT